MRCEDDGEGWVVVVWDVGLRVWYEEAARGVPEMQALEAFRYGGSGLFVEVALESEKEWGRVVKLRGGGIGRRFSGGREGGGR